MMFLQKEEVDIKLIQSSSAKQSQLHFEVVTITERSREEL